MTKQAIFTEAHRIARKLTGNYAARMSFALKMAYRKFKIVKRSIELSTSVIFNSFDYTNNYDIEMRFATYIYLKNDREMHPAYSQKIMNNIEGINTFTHLI